MMVIWTDASRAISDFALRTERLMDFSHSKKLRRRSHALIPGGCHTYAKGDDQYPEEAPGFIVRGEGCHVWDVDGNEFIEYGMGLRSVALGHAYPAVIDAAIGQMHLGTNFTRPSPLESECAEALMDLVPGAEMVKFGKNGSDATNAAVKLARAYTGRNLIAVCRQHPFFSVDDWFIATTSMNAGIPEIVRNLTKSFSYNDLESAQLLFDRFPKQIAALILEPEKEEPPESGFLDNLKRLCENNGALLILDEMITGFRWHNGGGQGFYKLTPHLAAFGKAMGNGFSVSALTGLKEIMQLGSNRRDRDRVFLLSLTHGAELQNLAAAKAVMDIYKREAVVDTLWRQGARLAAGIQRSIEAYGLEDYFAVSGRPCCLTYRTCDADQQPSQIFRTLFLQEIIKRGILAPSLIVSYSHTDSDIDRTVEVIHDALAIYRQALEEGPDKFLKGRPVRPVFRHV
jgi:glutamate-1-semialdehyde 2,1-aminomutase